MSAVSHLQAVAKFNEEQAKSWNVSPPKARAAFMKEQISSAIESDNEALLTRIGELHAEFFSQPLLLTANRNNVALCKVILLANSGAKALPPSRLMDKAVETVQKAKFEIKNPPRPRISI